MTEEHKVALREGREKARLTRGVQPTDDVSETALLHIENPTKWQMKVRLHLESLTDDEADTWMEGFRLIYEMAGKLCRDQFYGRTDGRCYICKKRFAMGRHAGEAGWYDGDRVYRRILCCDQSEMSDLMKIAYSKEQAVRQAEDEATEAARKALIAVRQANRGVPVGDADVVK